jgi:hypothetical protein
LAESCSGTSAVFVPHRRDRPDDTRLAQRSGAVVFASELPVELHLAGRETDLQVECLPSTPVLSLPRVVSAARMSMRCRPVPPGSFSTAASAPMRRLITLLGERAERYSSNA